MMVRKQIIILNVVRSLTMATDTNEDDVKVEVRLAQPEDYEQLLQVDSSVYFGHDYLPAKFHKFLRDPSRQFSVILVNDVVVSNLRLCLCRCIFG
jgi:hypothetical protein